MAKTIIRVPRTTAMFVTSLGRILREHFGFSITEHEHWTFEHVGEWSECSGPGLCHVHGMSKGYRQLLKNCNFGVESDSYGLDYVGACYPYKMSVYLGTGQAGVRGKKVQLRVRMEKTYHDARGDLFTARVWVRHEDGQITKGEFDLQDDERPYSTDKSMPDQPPRRLAFWRQAAEATPVTA